MDDALRSGLSELFTGDISHALEFNAVPGHYDVVERLKELDRDGVAAEVIYHGSQNGQCFPLLNTAGGTVKAIVRETGGCRR